MVITATLCGMNNFAEIEDFCELQLDWLRKWIKAPNGTPTAQTFANIFALIDPKCFNDCLQAHLGQISPSSRTEGCFGASPDFSPKKSAIARKPA